MESGVGTTLALRCQCCRDTRGELPNPAQAQRPPVLWRPWDLPIRVPVKQRDQRSDRDRELSCEPGEPSRSALPGRLLGFQHPVRLYLPRSKADEYLRGMGERVLASFPVQATMHFYNDDSDTGEEEEEEDEEQGA
ncbi:protein ripply3 [Callorhinchus milii]|uniref:protein ripply3 n=1 Tax=Callorhinchus milii TaxID=7868 RepID=UPI00045749AB|nr:protein ripply3 [Callorhinchus milii]|eukprot:gi/632988003/ref/XP_007882868.1/ PREDICTED: protein ripply3 [Callorhinchus milii]